MAEKQKTEIVAAKHKKDRGEISLSSQKDEDDCNRSDIDMDKKNDLNPAFL